MRSSDEAAVVVFDRQHGLITRAQALYEIEMTESAVDRRLRSGEWIKLEPGVYRHVHRPATWESRMLAACLGLDAVASHRSAARLWELEGVPWRGLEITMPFPRQHGRRRHDLVIHRSNQLHLAEPLERNGVRTTGIGRTLLDLAAVSSMERLEFALDDALRRELVTGDELWRTLRRHARRGRNGIQKFRLLLERRVPPTSAEGAALPDSLFNRAVARLLEQAGLGPFQVEHVVTDGLRRIARVDLAWPDEKLAIEADSIRYHFDHHTFQRDRMKRNELQLLGWDVLAFTWQDYLHRKQWIIATVRQSLRQRTRDAEASLFDAGGPDFGPEPA